MARTYSEWMAIASQYRANLNQAITDKDQKGILLHRGRYIYALNQAYKLTPSPALQTAIKKELINHQAHIRRTINANKVNSDVKNRTISTELGLKIRRLSTRVKQINFATNSAERKAGQKELVKDSFSLASTALVKTPIMAVAKVLSKVGPLVVHLAALPLALFNFGLSNTINIYNGSINNKPVTTTPYNKTAVYQLSDALANGIKSISGTIYKTTGRF